MSLNRKRLNRQRQVQHYHARSRGVIETEGDTVPSEREGFCSQVSESRSRGQQPQYENRPD